MMAQEITKHIFTGLTKDISPDKVDNKHYFDALNIRVSVTDDETLLSVKNERGNIKKVDNIKGKYLGKAILGDYIIIFTHEETNDHIYRINTLDYSVVDLYGKGLLGFNENNPIETVISYENEAIQKVYWCDGLNQNRVINIVKDSSEYNKSSFDFVRTFTCDGNLNVKKIYSSGSFLPGTIQYFATYFNKNGQESNIFAQSELYYTSNEDRGGEPNKSVSNSFKITVRNVDKTWDYVKIYSLLRTSKDTESYARVVTNININDTATKIFSGTVVNLVSYDESKWEEGFAPQEYVYKGADGDKIQISFKDKGVIKNGFIIYDSTSIFILNKSLISGEHSTIVKENGSNVIVFSNDNDIDIIDNGIGGESINPAELAFIGGNIFSCETMDSKENVLFMGNINIKSKVISSEVKNIFRDSVISWDENGKIIKNNNSKGFYDRSNQLDNSNCAGFKTNETYRFGVQFMDEHGIWSQPVFIGDSKNLIYPKQEGFNVIISKAIVNSRNNPKLSEALDLLINDGYIAYRPLVVLPRPSEYEVLAQGVINPTVYNIKDRFENGPWGQPSWFYRPIVSAFSDYKDNVNTKTKLSEGNVIAYRHGEGVYGGVSRASEINNGVSGIVAEYSPSNITSDHDSIYIKDNGLINSFVEKNANKYYIDTSLVTLDSPDITFNDNINIANSKLRINGIIELSAFATDNEINIKDNKGNVYKNKFHVDNLSSKNGCKISSNGAYYIEPFNSRYEVGPDSSDMRRRWYNGVYNVSKLKFWTGSVGYVMYAWNKVNNITANEGELHASVEHKYLSNLRYSYLTKYLDEDSEVNVKNVSLYDENKSVSYLIGDKYYYIPDKLITGKTDLAMSRRVQLDGLYALSNNGDIEELPKPATASYVDSLGKDAVENKEWFPRFGYDSNTDKEKGYDIDIHKYGYTIVNYDSRNDYMVANGGDDASGGGLYTFTAGTPSRYKGFSIPIQYRTTPHAIIQMDKPLPQVKNNNVYVNKICSQNSLNNSLHPYYNFNEDYPTQDYVNYNGNGFGFLFLGELYRDVENKFGGDSDYALQQNIWIPAGKSAPLSNEGISIEYINGDTYYQRYDHLKTYSYSKDAINNVVEILSFMVETRINIDGRYDKNRGLESNLYMDDSNFNIINKSYTQSDNVFQYNILDDRFNLNDFPNQITYTKGKLPNALVDSWTNVTLANTVDLDGDKGSINKIITFNDKVLAMQDNGIAEIMFNPNVQISSTEGLPIELANSGKVQGRRYIFDDLGVQNKRSVIKTKSGLWWVDNYSNSIYRYNNQIENISTNSGLSSWLSKNHDLRLDYDHYNGNIYALNKNYCIGYSEALNAFESFYSYNESDAMFSIKNKFLSLSNGKLWLHNDGEYNTYYDKIHPSYIEFVHNDHPEINKIYNILNYRAKFSNDNDTFNYFKISNEYQTTNNTDIRSSIMDTIKLDSTAKRKFRVWKYQIPRDVDNRFDRIQNTWSKIRIGYVPTGVVNGFKLYDVVVGYDI